MCAVILVKRCFGVNRAVALSCVARTRLLWPLSANKLHEAEWGNSPNSPASDALPLIARAGQVKAAFEKHKNPAQVAKELAKAARSAGSSDDITVVIAKLG